MSISHNKSTDSGSTNETESIAKNEVLARQYLERVGRPITPEAVAAEVKRQRQIQLDEQNDRVQNNINRRKAAYQQNRVLLERNRRMSIKHVASERDKFRNHAIEALESRRGSFSEVIKQDYQLKTNRYPSCPDNMLFEWGMGNESAFAIDGPVNAPSDFPNILSALANKILDTPYYDATVTYDRWAWKTKPVKNFKETQTIALGEFSEFPEHIDGDDFPDSTFLVETGTLRIGDYGDEFRLTPRMIADDNLDAFEDALRDKQAAHDLTLNRLLVELLTGNVALVDGYYLFDDQHGNDIADGGAPSTDELDKIRLKLRKQIGISGQRKMGYDLALLLIPEDIETVTQKLLQATLNVHPTSANDAEPFRGIDYVVEPMLNDSISIGGGSSTRYFGFADPKRARSIVYAHQVGYEKMKVRDYYNPANNCRHYQCEGRFGVGVRNHRGVVRDSGVASE